MPEPSAAPTPTPHPDAQTPALHVLEAYYDAAPRPLATTEQVGPFTLFVRCGSAGWPYYARPRLGLADPIAGTEVRRVLDRQAELGVPQALEWVHQTTPTLLEAARGAGMHVEQCPLLVLPARDDAGGREPIGERLELRDLGPDDADLGAVTAAVHAGFGDTDQPGAPDAGDRPEQMRRGLLHAVGAFLAGEPVGGGSHAPRGDTTELVGIAVLPRARGQGIGAAATARLVAHARAHGIRHVFLSAQDDAVARVYERVGFRRVGTACVAQAPSSH